MKNIDQNKTQQLSRFTASNLGAAIVEIAIARFPYENSLRRINVTVSLYCQAIVIKNIILTF